MNRVAWYFQGTRRRTQEIRSKGYKFPDYDKFWKFRGDNRAGGVEDISIILRSLSTIQGEEDEKRKGGEEDEERKEKKGGGGRAYRHIARDRPREGREKTEQGIWQGE